ncbi:MAG: FHA domain-containing protein [Deltaproteobacteria bacterium]|nr:FHA domain-containing protein [Myxococcales bacterium]MDP3213135.1 FHA domain-containing protein [Deltaproteobacteria bacterium]
MPTFVIHALGKPASKVTLDGERVRVGRDPGNDLVLPDESVSREHAIFARDGDGRWVVQCVSETNAVVLDGRMVTSAAAVAEGNEILLGSDHLIVFSEDPFKADGYIQIKSGYERKRCPTCKWEGMTSSLRLTACPRCAAPSLEAVDTYRGSASSAPQAATAAVDPAQAKALFSKLKSARMSYLERADGKVEGSIRTELSESKGATLGSGADPSLKVFGIHFGEVSIAWAGEHFEARSSMLFPAMKVNGEKAKVARLRNGDVIEIGGNQFRFATT